MIQPYVPLYLSCRTEQDQDLVVTRIVLNMLQEGALLSIPHALARQLVRQALETAALAVLSQQQRRQQQQQQQHHHHASMMFLGSPEQKASLLLQQRQHQSQQQQTVTLIPITVVSSEQFYRTWGASDVVTAAPGLGFAAAIPVRQIQEKDKDGDDCKKEDEEHAEVTTSRFVVPPHDDSLAPGSEQSHASSARWKNSHTGSSSSPSPPQPPAAASKTVASALELLSEVASITAATARS